MSSRNRYGERECPECHSTNVAQNGPWYCQDCEHEWEEDEEDDDDRSEREAM